MDLISSVFSTREIALGIWIILLLLVFSFDKKVRNATVDLFKSFFVTAIQLSILALVVYITTVTLGLSYFGVWTKSLLKDTIVWSITVAFVMQINANGIRDKNYFKDVVKDTLKWTIVLEYVLSLYTFSLWIELILIPVLIFLTALQAVSTIGKKYEKVQNLLSKIILIISLMVFIVSIYKTIENLSGIWTINNLITLIFPIIMTLLLIPFIYCYTVYMKYDEIFSLINHWSKDKASAGNIKRQVVGTAKLNLWILRIIRIKLYMVDFAQTNVNGIIRQIVNEDSAGNKKL